MNYKEIIMLGNHRLMCGDATNREDIMKLIQGSHAKLLFTSPPYSDIYQYSGNDLSPEHLASFIPAVQDFADILCVNLGLKKHNHEIITYWDEYIHAAQSCGLKLLSWNVWDKINPGSIAQQQFMFPLRHEFIFVFGKNPMKLNRTIPKHGRIDPRNDMSIRQQNGTLSRTTKNPQLHETHKQLETVIVQSAVKARPVWGAAQMPVELAQEYITAITNEGDYVIDTFGGTGTTLIACEKTRRKCLIMEISQESCEVIKKRWEVYTKCLQ